MTNMWPSFFLLCLAVLSANGFSKYGRGCKDIGCLNNEICVMAEDPCSYGRTSECGTYPTCKRKTAADGETHNEPPPKPTTPRPIAEIRPQQPPKNYDDTPNYPPPPPPRGGSPYGNNQPGGSPYGNNQPGGSSSGGSGFTNPFSNFNFGNIASGFGLPGGSSGGTSGGTNSGTNSGTNPLTSIFSNIFGNLTKGGLLPALNPSFTRPGLIENPNYNNPNPSNPYANQPNPYANQPNPYQPNPYFPNNPAGAQPYPGYPGYGGNQRQGYQPNNAALPAGGSSQGQPTQQNGYVAKNYGTSHTANSVRNYATTAKPSGLLGWLMG